MAEFRVKGVEGIFGSRDIAIIAETVNANASALLQLKKEVDALRKEIEELGREKTDDR